MTFLRPFRVDPMTNSMACLIDRSFDGIFFS
jgi:hypothetical protein